MDTAQPHLGKERILNEAEFKREAIDYFVTSITIALLCTVFGIVLIPLVRPIARWYWTRYYHHLRVYLTTRDLKVHRGLLNKEEKSIPLEKVTDLAVFQGPIMRHYGVRGIRVETAGQSNQHGALVRVVGIVDVDSFRDLVLAQRDRIADRDDAAAAAVPQVSARVAVASDDGPMLATLTDIRDTLRRIEEQLSKQRA